MSRNSREKLSTVQKMPRHLQGMLAMYLCGIDVRSMYSRVGYYKNKASLKRYGYDISKQIKAEYLPQSKQLDLALNEYV